MAVAKEPIEPFVALEFFAGVHAIASAFSKHGHHTMAFDILRDPSHDLNQCVGLMMGVISVLHLPCGSLAHFALVCTSFCWINSATHGRSMSFPLGDVQRTYVQEGTALAFSTVTCMAYIHMACVFFEYIVHREKPRLLFVGLRGYVDVSPQWNSLATATLFIIQEFNGGSNGFRICKPTTNLATWMSYLLAKLSV